MIYFYQCLKFGKLFNKKDCVRMESSRVYQFNIDNITIQENKDYNAVAETMAILNSELQPNVEKFIYCGQSIHRLAKSYYDRNFDCEFVSQMSPQVAYIFNDRMSKNTSFNLPLKTRMPDMQLILTSIMPRYCGVVMAHICLVGANLYLQTR